MPERPLAIYARPLLLGSLALAFSLGGAMATANALRAQRPDTAAFRRAAEYSKGERGDGVLVMIDGRIVFEDYHNGGAANWRSASAPCKASPLRICVNTTWTATPSRKNAPGRMTRHASATTSSPGSVPPIWRN